MSQSPQGFSIEFDLAFSVGVFCLTAAETGQAAHNPWWPWDEFLRRMPFLRHCVLLEVRSKTTSGFVRSSPSGHFVVAALAFSDRKGVRVERTMIDDGPAYKDRAFRKVLTEGADIAPPLDECVITGD